jgi:hypothetical protein
MNLMNIRWEGNVECMGHEKCIESLFEEDWRGETTGKN